MLELSGGQLTWGLIPYPRHPEDCKPGFVGHLSIEARLPAFRLLSVRLTLSLGKDSPHLWNSSLGALLDGPK